MKKTIVAAAAILLMSLTACTVPATGIAASSDKSTSSKLSNSDTGTSPTTAGPAMTKGQQNAVKAAQNYLKFKAFSRQGLINQLHSEYGDGYPKKDATFAVDHLKVNWKKQAAKAAKEYLKLMPFSRNGLVRQLESRAGDGYTHAQAVYGVKQAGL